MQNDFCNNIRVHICLEISWFEGHCTTHHSTLHQTQHFHSTWSSSQVLNESQLCNSGETRFGKSKLATWLSPIIFILKKLKICINCHKLNTTKNDLYPSLPFTKIMFDTITCHEIYPFLDGFLSYNQIMIALKHRYKIIFITNCGRFVWIIMPFGLSDAPPSYL